MHRLLPLLLLICCALLAGAQGAAPGILPDSSKSGTDTYRNSSLRTTWVGAATAAGFGGTLLLLNSAWYQQYTRSGFHTFNDSREWLQVDKVGHGWSAYQLSRGTTALWQWAGLPARKAVLAGSISSLAFMTSIELLDAYSQKWGWSWADMGANLGGTGLFAAQQLAWGAQRVQLKFSSGKAHHPQGVGQRVGSLFGNTLPERILKDYNAQTYWLSTNLNAWGLQGRVPAWLNVAVGYGASGMYGGFANRAYDHDGNLVFDRTDLPRRRQWYLAPDVDLTRIKTRHKGWKTVLFALNCIKVPAPALLLEGGRLRVKALAF